MSYVQGTAPWSPWLLVKTPGSKSINAQIFHTKQECSWESYAQPPLSCTSVYFFFCAYMCMSVHAHVCLCVCTYVQAHSHKRQTGTLGVILILLRRLLIKPKAFSWVCWLASGLLGPPSLPPNTGAAGTYDHAWFLCGCLRIQTRVLKLALACSYSLSRLPPWLVFLSQGLCLASESQGPSCPHLCALALEAQATMPRS